jgi:hypothetical protein
MLQPIAAPVAATLALVMLLPSAVYDRVTTGRVHPVSLWGAVFVFSFTLAFFVGIASTTVWRDFAVWLVRESGPAEGAPSPSPNSTPRSAARLPAP